MAKDIGLQIAMHSLMAAVVLRLAWPAEYRLHSQRHQPHTHARESAVRCPERWSVVALHGLRQPMLSENSLDHWPRVSKIGRPQSLARKQKPAHRSPSGLVGNSTGRLEVET